MRKILFALILLLIINDLFAQKKINGYIILKNNDTLKVFLKVQIDVEKNKPMLLYMQYKIIYFDSDNRKKKLYPPDAQEIGFVHEDIPYKMVSIKNSLNISTEYNSEPEYIFIQQLKKGSLSLYLYNYSTGNSYSSRYMYSKKGADLIYIQPQSFRTDMAEYLSDCTDLAARIESKEFGLSDVEKIVDIYNSTCGK